MEESMYRDDYYKEYLYQIVDNLNILYVATTRAICSAKPRPAIKKSTSKAPRTTP